MYYLQLRKYGGRWRTVMRFEHLATLGSAIPRFKEVLGGSQVRVLFQSGIGRPMVVSV
jgi:hypothetical protein